MQASVDGNNNIVLYTFRLPQRLGATWELLVDPATVAFAAGGLMLLAIWAWRAGWPAWRLRRAMGALFLCVLAWLPVRAVLLMAIYLYRVLRTEYDAPIDLMDQFWSTWVHLLLLGGAVFLTAVFVRPAPGGHDDKRGDMVPLLSRPRRLAVALFAVAGVAALSAGIFFNPPGARKGGRFLSTSITPSGRTRAGRSTRSGMAMPRPISFPRRSITSAGFTRPAGSSSRSPMISWQTVTC